LGLKVNNTNSHSLLLKAMLESLTLFVRTVTYSFIGLSFFVRCSAKLPPTVWRLAQWRISEHKTVNTPQKLMRGRMFNEPLHPPLSQTPVLVAQLKYTNKLV